MKLTKQSLAAAITFYFLLSTFNCFAQLDTIHWLPPLHSRQTLTTGNNGQVTDHWVYLSTPIATPFTVTITDGAGTVLGTRIISNSSPARYFVGNGQSNAGGSQLFIQKSRLNTVLTNKGIICHAPQPFFVNSRINGGNQAEWETAKGRAGLGTTFRYGGFPQSNIASTNGRNFTMGIMATQNSTTITISGYNAAITFDGVPPITPPSSFTINLNQGECYVVAGNNTVGANGSGFMGALIQSDKPIVLNNGNLAGTIHPTNFGNQDFGIDLSVPIERLGKEYILIEGQGNAAMEKPIVIAHTNNTAIYINGSLIPITTINAGAFFVVPNNNYQGTAGQRNMYIRTSEPAYIYQALASSSTNPNATGGLVLVPPIDFGCFLPNSIDLIPAIDSIGNVAYTSGLLITTILGSVVQINGGAPLTGAEPVLGTTWETYKILNLTGNIAITSTNSMMASVIGLTDPAGFAGYFSGFSTIPLASDFTFTDTCFSSLTSFNANFDTQFNPDSIGWNFGDPTSGINNTANGSGVTHIFTSPGIYTVQMVVFRCQNDTITKNITIIPSSKDSLNLFLCQGDSIVIGGNTYASSGTYMDTLTNVYGCDSIITTNLTINPAATFSQTFAECERFNITVGSNVYDSTGVFIDTLITSTGCDSIITTNLTITAPITTTQTFIECEGFSVTVGLNTYTTTGVFIDIFNNCDTIITDLTINNIPQLTLIKTDDNCGEQIGSVTAVASTNNPPITYNWNTGSTDTIINNLPAGFYSIVVTDSNNCSISGAVNLQNSIDSCEQTIFIPNVFSPNGDNQNDLFSIKMIGFEFENLKIYNRWGVLLFETDNINEGWDGKTTSGKEAIDGTYFFILSYKSNNEKQVEKGTLTLFR